MSILFTLLLQVAEPAVARLPAGGLFSDSTRRLVQPYWDCAHTKSEVFEKSGEAADLVARASIEACMDERRTLFASMFLDTLKGKAKRLDPKDIIEEFDEIVTSSVILKTVKIRAKTNAQNK